MLQAGVAMSGDNDQVDLMLAHELDDLLKWFAEFDVAAGGNGIFACYPGAKFPHPLLALLHLPLISFFCGFDSKHVVDRERLDHMDE